MNFNWVFVSIKCGDGYDVIVVDIVDVKFNVFNFFWEGLFECIVIIGVVVDWLKFVDCIDCFGVVVDVIDV